VWSGVVRGDAARQLKENAMLQIPNVDEPGVVFGDITHMPKFDTLPEEFRRERSLYCAAVSHWFYGGAKRDGDTLIIDGKRFKAKPGVDATKALKAIKAVLGSWEPKHEHKIAACGFMLSEWFELAEKG
jgi:hypothetical protein